jgi:hypothetical protein
VLEDFVGLADKSCSDSSPVGAEGGAETHETAKRTRKVKTSITFFILSTSYREKKIATS